MRVDLVLANLVILVVRCCFGFDGSLFLEAGVDLCDQMR